MLRLPFSAAKPAGRRPLLWHNKYSNQLPRVRNYLPTIRKRRNDNASRDFWYILFDPQNCNLKDSIAYKITEFLPIQRGLVKAEKLENP